MGSQETKIHIWLQILIYRFERWIHWNITGAYWKHTKSLYSWLRRQYLTLKWMLFDMTIQRVLKRIYIGDVASLKVPDAREQLRIKAMVCCAREINPNLEGIKYFLHLPLYDGDWIHPEFIEDAMRFIHRHARHRPVLIACAGGASRSAGIILCYMIEKGWNFNDALKHLQKIRPIVNPHPLILLSIRKYYKIPPY